MGVLRFCWIIVVVMGLMAGQVEGQPGAGAQINVQGKLVQDLSGYQWKVKGMPPGQGVQAGLHELPYADIETLGWISGRVPGDVYTDLWKAGVIEDPYFGRNSYKAQWVMFKEWWYSLQFNVSEDLGDRVVRLEFDGVDFSCDVWLNGHYLGSHEGMFSPFAFEVTDYIHSSKNWNKGRNMVMVKLNPPPQVNHKVVGLKTPWFGDYWRDLVPFGIWRPVRLVATGGVRVEDVYVKPQVRSDQSAELEIELTLENHGEANQDVAVTVDVQGQNFKSDINQVRVMETVGPGLNLVRLKLGLAKPKLWWPWDLGEQNLYSAQVVVKQGGKVQDRKRVSFGVRDLQMAWNPGFTRDEVSFPRTVKINGKTHFIRSACWGGPPDILVGRTSPAEYKKLIDMAKAANMNNIRIFGWHPPEIPEFYQYCDEAGLTVWQDVIPLGTGNISQEPAFLERIYAEAGAVIRERRNHPSLILIEGGEEAFLRASDPAFTKQFLEELGRRLHQYVDLPYVPDSPLTCPNAQSVGFKSKEAVHALGYFYSMGKWLMEDWYKSLDFPIVPELAVTSVPPVESLKRFIPADELWPPGPSWGHHWADLDRLRMQNYDTFGDTQEGSLEEFVNATQDAQGTIFQLAVEHFRRGKPRVSGIALCHYITYWPDMKWGIVDNYQVAKRSYDYVKRAYQPLLVSLDFDRRRWHGDETFLGRLWLINDYDRRWSDCRIVVDFMDEQGQELARQQYEVGEIRPDSSVQVESVSWAIKGQVSRWFEVKVRLEDSGGAVLSSNRYRLLIGDQKEAAETMKRMGQAMKQRAQKYLYSNYYRFFPELLE